MKHLSFILFFLAIHSSGFLSAQSEYESTLEASRTAKNKELKGRKTSLLQKADRKGFEHLNYFEINPTWKVEASFSKNSNEDIIEIPTSAGTNKTFQAYGKLNFQLEGQDFELTAYKRIWPNGKNPYPGHESLFVPFKDLTTGDETYGGGRYLDIPIPKENETLWLDFNTCYNPYCAYGGGFSCPIPPQENFIDLKVTAGETAYNKH